MLHDTECQSWLQDWNIWLGMDRPGYKVFFHAYPPADVQLSCARHLIQPAHDCDSGEMLVRSFLVGATLTGGGELQIGVV